MFDVFNRVLPVVGFGCANCLRGLYVCVPKVRIKRYKRGMLIPAVAYDFDALRWMDFWLFDSDRTESADWLG